MLFKSLCLNYITSVQRRKLAIPHFYNSHVFIQNTKIINTQGERQFALENLQTKLIILSEKACKHTKAARELTHRMTACVSGECKSVNKGNIFVRWMRYSAKVISIIPIKHQSSTHLLVMIQLCILWIYCISFYLDCILALLLTPQVKVLSAVLDCFKNEWKDFIYIDLQSHTQTLNIWWGFFCVWFKFSLWEL